MELQTVLVVIDDLFFLSEVQTILAQLGMAAKVVADPDTLRHCVEDTTPALAVVDLTLRTGTAVDLIRAIRATDRGCTLPILAFGAHVAVDTRQQALQAGADHVVAKSEFSKRLPDLIQQYAG